MPTAELPLMAVSIGILAIVAARLVWMALVQTRQTGAVPRNRDGSFPMACTVCGAQAIVRSADLVTLSAAEKALAVRERPDSLGKNLVEFICPRCDASHCYDARRDSLNLVGVNLYQGQRFQANCKECRKTLSLPSWHHGEFDGHIKDAPGDLTDLGLKCALCGAISCVDCCRQATRNRTADGSLLCPRCYRGPIDRFFHHTRAELGEPERG